MLMGAIFYPCQVLATNRILRTSAVAQSPGYVSIFSHLQSIYRLGSLWRGFLPYVGSLGVKILPVKIAYGASRYNDFLGSVIVTALSTFFANPLEILAVRYQNVDFKRGETLSQDFKRMLSKEETSVFRTGLYHAIARNLIFMFFMTQRMETPDSLLTAISLGTIVSHPFEVLKSRQMWAATGGNAEKLAVGQNIRSGFKLIWKEEGIRGLYRGLAPRWLFYVLIGNQLFAKEERQRRGQS